VNGAEAALIAAGTAPGRHMALPWRSLLDLNLALVCLMYFCYAYGLYFYLTWLPTYLREARGFSPANAAAIASVVLLTAGAATVVGGRVSDWLVRRYGLKAGRSVGAAAMPLSGLCMAAAALSSDGRVAAAAMVLAAAFGDLCISPSWAICHDIGGEAAGTVTGSMNTLGNLGGALSPLVVGYSVQWFGSWSAPLLVTAAVYVAGGVLTLAIDPRRRLSAS
jgi:nitrate/nitrite transporter NarK